MPGKLHLTASCCSCNLHLRWKGEAGGVPAEGFQVRRVPWGVPAPTPLPGTRAGWLWCSRAARAVQLAVGSCFIAKSTFWVTADLCRCHFTAQAAWLREKFFSVSVSRISLYSWHWLLFFQRDLLFLTYLKMIWVCGSALGGRNDLAPDPGSCFSSITADSERRF